MPYFNFSEAVAGVVGRADILAAVFFLLALLAFSKHLQIRDKRPSSVTWLGVCTAAGSGAEAAGAAEVEVASVSSGRSPAAVELSGCFPSFLILSLGPEAAPEAEACVVC